MESNVYASVNDCWKCARHKTPKKRHHSLHFILASGRLRLVAMGILGPLRNWVKRQLVLTNNDLSLLQDNGTYTDIYDDCIPHRIIAHGLVDSPALVTTPVLLDNWMQFVIRLLRALGAILGTNHLRTTAYHLQTNSQANSFNKMFIIRLRQNFDEH